MFTKGRATEQGLLLQSAAMMALVAAGGTVMGILSDSHAVLLDGIFSLIAVLIKLLMLETSHLIRRETSVKFQFGYWQLEPLVLFVEGAFTLVVVLYAAAAGIQGLLHGGNDVDFGMAVYYALFFAIADTAFYFYVRKVNRTLRSNLVHFDNVSWSIDAALAVGLLISFGGAWLLEHTAYAYYSRYVDPLIMIALAVYMMLPTFHILSPSFKQILGEAPEDVHEHVQTVMDSFMKRYGFKDYVSSVQQYGSTRIIEIDILLPKNYPETDLAEFDTIRNQIDAAIGYRADQKWVTITFTTTRRWMAKDYLVAENI